MIARIDSQYDLNGKSPISSYKKALLAIFNKKKAWNYVNMQRESASKRKQEFKKYFVLDAEVVYH